MDKDIINGEISSVNTSGDTAEVSFTDELGASRSHRLNFAIDDHTNLTGMYLQVRLDQGPLSYTYKEWIGAEAE